MLATDHPNTIQHETGYTCTQDKSAIISVGKKVSKGFSYKTWEKCLNKSLLGISVEGLGISSGGKRRRNISLE